MKIFSFILVMLTFFLTVQPVLTLVVSTAEQGKPSAAHCCPAKPDVPAQKSNKTCCDNGLCKNPFLSCSNCYFVNRSQSCFSPAGVLMQKRKIRLVNDKSLSSFEQDFWHPPERACFLNREQTFRT